MYYIGTLMHIEQFRDYCLSKPATSEDFPFGPENLVLRVGGKIFAITDVAEAHFKVNLKCEPDYALELREQHTEVMPGYHMNKRHWNTIDFDGSLDDATLRHLIDHSYELVAKSLKKSDRAALGL